MNHASPLLKSFSFLSETAVKVETIRVFDYESTLDVNTYSIPDKGESETWKKEITSKIRDATETEGKLFKKETTKVTLERKQKC